MISLSQGPSTTKKLNYLLHKCVHGQENSSKPKTVLKSEEKQLNQSFTKTSHLPAILPNQRTQNISSENQSLASTLKSPQNRESQFRNSTATQISGKQYIEVNKSILKMIEEKIYPMNKDVTFKLKLRNNFSCETARNMSNQKNEGSIVQNKPIKKELSKKKKRKQKPAHRISNILDEKLQMTNRSKRTKSQEEIIRLQAKVESYLRDRKKILKVKYDEEMENMLQNSMNSSPKAILKQETKQCKFQGLLTRSSSKNFIRSNNNSFIKKQKQSELKRVIKLFQERGHNFTNLETERKQKTRFQLIQKSQIQKDNLKELTGVSKKDLSMSLKMISNIVNRKYEEVKDIIDVEVKHARQCQEQEGKIIQMNESDKIQKIEKREKSEKKLQSKKLGNSKKKIVLNKSLSNSPQMNRNTKIVTDLPNKQNDPNIQESLNYEALNQKSYKILPSNQGKQLDKQLNKELLGHIHQQLLDERKNLLKKKINEKKLLNRRKDSCIFGMALI